MEAGLNKFEISRVVNRYIGVSAGYLGDFSYRTHAEFYADYCDLDIDPHEYEGTTRARFIEILSTRAPRDQAKILKGVLEKFPAEPGRGPGSRIATKPQIEKMIERLLSSSLTVDVEEAFTVEVVREALADARVLLRERSPTSAVDRVHTALHGYLRERCRDAGITIAEDASTTALLKTLRADHPGLQDLGPRSDDIRKVMNAAASILDAFGPLRNRGSMAHPNENLLAPEEATLVVNIGHSLIGYLAAKLGTSDSTSPPRPEPDEIDPPL